MAGSPTGGIVMVALAATPILVVAALCARIKIQDSGFCRPDYVEAGARYRLSLGILFDASDS